MSDIGQIAEREGYDAAMAGEDIGTNPYSEFSLVLCQAWRRGFQLAERDEAEESGHFRSKS